MSIQPICMNCRRPLTDPVSVSIGLGPECRGSSSGSGSRRKLSKKQRVQLGRVMRAEQFINGQDVTFPDAIYHRDPERGWTRDGVRFTSDEEFGRWLEQSNLADKSVMDALRAIP